MLATFGSGSWGWAGAVTPGNAIVKSVAVDSLGSVFVTGNFGGNPDFDMGPGTAIRSSNRADGFVAKYSSAGALQWLIQIGGTEEQYPTGIAVDPSGNVLVTGYFSGATTFGPGLGTTISTSPNGYDGFVLKLNSLGQGQWVRTFGGGYGCYLGSIATDNTGAAIVVGAFRDSTIDFDPGAATANLTATGRHSVVVKLDASGTYAWSGTFAGGEASDVATDGLGNILVTGFYQYTVDFDPGPGTATMFSESLAAYAVKLSSAGAHRWARSIGNIDWARSPHAAFDSNGNALVAGQFSGTVDFDPTVAVDTRSASGSSWDAFATKFSDVGDYLWTSQISGAGDEVFGSMATNSAGDVFLAGQFTDQVDADPGPGVALLTSAGGTDVLLVHLSATGEYRSATRYGGAAGDYATGVALDSSGNPIIVGQFNDAIVATPVEFGPQAGAASLAGGDRPAFILKLNHAPSEITLSNSSIAENQPAGTTVGTLSTTDPNAGDTFTYELVSGDGSAGNGAFAIVDAELRTTASFDHETQSVYSVRIRSTDQGGLFTEKAFTIEVTDGNDAPSDLLISSNRVAENRIPGVIVGSLSALDADIDDSFSYSLVPGTGGQDNALFSIDGAALKTAAAFDYETRAAYSIRVRAADAAGASIEKAIEITVADVGATLFWLGDGKVQRGAADGSFRDVILEGSQLPGGVITNLTVDPAEQRIYWAERAATASNSKIYTAKFDGSDVQAIPTSSPLGWLNYGMVVDSAAGYLFLHSHDPAPIAPLGPYYDGRIQRIDIATGEVSLFPSGLWYANLFADTATQTVYYTDVSGFASGGPSIYRLNGIKSVNYDGLSTGSVPVSTEVPTGSLAVDTAAGTVYYVTGGGSQSKAIWTAEISGGAGTLITATNGTAFGVGIDGYEPRVYWADTSGIHRIWADGTQAEVIFSDAVAGVFAQHTTGFFVLADELGREPIDISLSATSIPENAGANAVVGILSTSDPDAGDSFTYSLVGGTGATDNAAFYIAGNHLRATSNFIYEAMVSYSVRIRSTDQSGLYTEKAFTITVSPTSLTDIESAGQVALSHDRRGVLHANGVAITTAAGIPYTVVGLAKAGWTPVAADVDGGRNTLVLRYSTGHLTFLRFDANWRQIPGSGGWIAPGTNAYFAQELAFDADLDGDGLVTIEKAGDVTLAYDARSGALRAGDTPIIYRNAPLNYRSLVPGGWRAMAAEVDQGLNTVVLKDTAGGNLRFWRMDADWGQVSGDGWITPDTVGFFQTEVAFGVDLDGNGGVTIETAGDVLFAYDGEGNLRANGTVVLDNENPVNYHQMVVAGWRPMAADVAADGRNTVVLHHESGRIRYWRFDAAWNRQTADGWISVSSLNFFAAEAFYGADLNGNGGRTIEAAGSTILTIDRVGLLRAHAVSGGTVDVAGALIVSDGQPTNYYAMAKSGWTAKATELYQAKNTVLLEYSTGFLRFWRLDATWNRTSGDGWIATNSLAALGIETAFGVDVNGDGRIGA